MQNRFPSALSEAICKLRSGRPQHWPGVFRRLQPGISPKLFGHRSQAVFGVGNVGYPLSPWCFVQETLLRDDCGDQLFACGWGRKVQAQQHADDTCRFEVYRRWRGFRLRGRPRHRGRRLFRRYEGCRSLYGRYRKSGTAYRPVLPLGPDSCSTWIKWRRQRQAFCWPGALNVARRTSTEYCVQPGGCCRGPTETVSLA